MESDNQHFSGKVALITGGSRGIGRAIAGEFASRGTNLVVNYFLNKVAGRQAVEELQAKGVKVLGIRGNIGKELTVARIVNEIQREFGRLDFLVSNAALGGFGQASDIEERHWDLAMDTNARAFLRLVKSTLPLMRRGSRVVALTSLGSSRALPGYASIGTSKAALECLVRYFAAELAPRGINVNAVAGGFIATDALKDMPQLDEMKKEALRRTPLGRLGEPEEIARIVSFLCGPGGDFIVGQTIVADGGFSLT